ncbi:hypothetical protein DRO91_06075 [Candidatus Heimdallarchaeota archaeon]|nr:MAG: hypothetical protein DRO91_06075 [Candidatus Heimdallarchaeota archaeon]
MAYLATIHCVVCDETKEEVIGAGALRNVCGSCMRAENKKREVMHLKGLEALTTEERLKRIESWIYNYKPHREPRC